ncbi:MAG: hypothetical protein QM709_00740 [Spongiibacteraceae bacterium]
MKRPASSFNAADGLLRAEHFQVAYATTDIEQAKQVFADRYGIKNYRQLKGQMPTGGHIHIELAWVGSTMYELVTSSGPGSETFMSDLPSEGFALRHHHLGFLISSDAEWNAMLIGVERNGGRILSKSENTGFMKTCMIKIPELGHCLEYLFPEPAGLAFLENVPAN